MSDGAWNERSLEDLSETIKDGTHGSFKRVSRGVPLLSAKNVAEDGRITWNDEDDRVSEEDYLAITSSFKPKKDDVLITIVGTLGRRAMFDEERVAFQRSVAFVRPDQSRVTPRFLYHAVGSPDYVRQLVRRSNATAQAGLYLGELSQTTIRWPSDLNEQHRIEAALDLIDCAIAEAETVIAKLQHVRTGMLHDLLTRGLDESGQLRDPLTQPKEFKDSLLGRIPIDWKVRTCESLCHEIVVGIVVKPAQYYVDEGVPTLRSANVRENSISLTDLVYISPEANRLLVKSMLHTGNLVTVRTGYPGTTSVVPELLDETNCVDLIISRPKAEIDSQFLAWWINSPLGKDQVLKAQGGLAQQHFNVSEMKQLLVLKPELDEQRRIVAVLQEAEAAIESEENIASKLKNVRVGLATDLLTGRVRVAKGILATETHE